MKDCTSLKKLELEIYDTQQDNLYNEILNLYMIRHGVDGKTLARLIGVTEPTISYWRTGKRLPKSDMLYYIAKALDLTIFERTKQFSACNTTQYLGGLATYLRTAVQDGCGDDELGVIKLVLERLPEIE